MNVMESRKKSKSLLIAVWDGSLDTGMRMLLTVALAAGLVAMVGLITAVCSPAFSKRSNWDEMVMGVSFIPATIVWIPLVYVLWTRGIGHKPILFGVLGSVGLIGHSIGIGIVIDSMVRWQYSEIWIFTLVFATIFLVGLLWTWVLWWGYKRRLVWDMGEDREVYCVDCGYNLHGRRDTTCPECGATPTLEELVRGQGMAMEKAGKGS
ncbi:hypothetical protein [Poriferisphaera sp. WC338]|uniref:hypothetical protein n=1 Tax=Poriferisphaera sp. WC338 TaxID=3425129 RepID=UPI003D815B84